MNNIMYPLKIKKAQDCYLYDESGNRYIDFTSSIFTASVGHSNKRVLQAIKRQIKTPLLHCYGFDTQIKQDYVKKLKEFTGYLGDFDVFICNTGSEAVEWALTLMRLWNEKHGNLGTIYGFPDAFHGKTTGARALYTDLPYVSDIKPLKLLPSDIVGMVVETFEGWSVKFHDQEYIIQLAEILKNRNCLLAFDEMQAGFGRTGANFGFEWYKVVPDIIICGKGMGGGIPIAGVLARKGIMELAGEMSTTHSGNPLSCAVGLAVLEEIERRDLVNRAYYLGKGISLFLKKLSEKHGIKFNGKGMMWAIILKDVETANELCFRCMKKGLLLVRTNKQSVKIAPPLTIPENILLQGLEIIRGELCELLK